MEATTARGDIPRPVGVSRDLVQLLWALAGLIAEPSFHFGDGAADRSACSASTSTASTPSPASCSLPPAFFFALKPRWAVLYAIYVAAALFVTGIWAFFDKQPAYVFTFPNNHSDAYFHLATGAVFALIAASRSPATAARSGVVS